MGGRASQDRDGEARSSFDASDALGRRTLIDAIERENQPLALLLLEVDDFERFAANHGRATAARALRQVAELVCARCRDADVVARYYHDQLAVLLPGPDMARVVRFAEDVRTAVAHHRFEPDGHRVTVSMGLAEPTVPSSGHALTWQANERLRRARLLGGNRVVSGGEAMREVDPPHPCEEEMVIRPRRLISPSQSFMSDRAGDEEAGSPLGVLELSSRLDLLAVLERELPQHHPGRRSLSLVMLQLDRTCERHSHDHVLGQVAALVRQHARAVDVVARYRVHQLVVIVPGLELDDAASFAETLRVAIERRRFERDGHHVTASFGVAPLLLWMIGAGLLIDETDTRLCRAIRLGGNRVMSWNDEDCVRISPRVPDPSEWRAFLVALDGAQLGRRYELEQRAMTIGRNEACDIHVVDQGVSRTHATITADGREVTIRDRDSKNGLYVNGVRIHECTLHYGDVVALGETTRLLLTSRAPGTSNDEELSPIDRVQPMIDLSTDANTQSVMLASLEPPPET